MEQYKQEFIEFMISCEVLKFGDFVTKSGRKTPFFVNTGFYRTGTQLKELGAYYARAIHAAFGDEASLLFGPAYKGIPLCVAASIGMSELYEKELGYVANRKEVKDHGDKGILLGAPIKDTDKIVIVEDVTGPRGQRGPLRERQGQKERTLRDFGALRHQDDGNCHHEGGH